MGVRACGSIVRIWGLCSTFAGVLPGNRMFFHCSHDEMFQFSYIVMSSLESVWFMAGMIHGSVTSLSINSSHNIYITTLLLHDFCAWVPHVTWNSAFCLEIIWFHFTVWLHCVSLCLCVTSSVSIVELDNNRENSFSILFNFYIDNVRCRYIEIHSSWSGYLGNFHFGGCSDFCPSFFTMKSLILMKIQMCSTAVFLWSRILGHHPLTWLFEDI